MKRSLFHGQRPYWVASILAPLLLFVLACGPGQEPTPTPTTAAAPTATPTKAPAATPTPTQPGPAATPTPTTVATPTPTPGVQPKRGGTIMMTINRYPPNFDLQIASGTFEMSSLGELYNNLFLNPKGNVIECEICKEWHLENNGKTMVFTLIQGIKFHDGRELTAADVEYSLEKINGQVDGIISPRCGVFKEYVESYELPSRYELRINLVRPSAFVPKVLSVGSCAIYPKGVTGKQLQPEPYGSGPFILTKKVSGASLTVNRNPNYFKPGLPYLDTIELTVVADENAQAATFLTHKTEFSSTSEPQYLPQFNRLKDEGKMESIKSPRGCTPVGVFMNNFKPPFDNIKVRKALNLALDRVAWGKVVWEGDSVPQLLFAAGTEFGRPESEMWDVVPGWGRGVKKQQEIEQAKQLLVDAGYPRGIDIVQLNQSSRIQDTMNLLVQQQVAEIGIRSKIELLLLAQLNVRRSTLDYVSEVTFRCQTTMDPDEMMGGYWITGAARNWQGYSSPVIDRLFPIMSAELDPAKRLQLVRQMEDIIVIQDVAYGAMPDSNTEHFVWKRLGGYYFGLSPTYGSGYNRKEGLWLKE